MFAGCTRTTKVRCWLKKRNSQKEWKITRTPERSTRGGHVKQNGCQLLVKCWVSGKVKQRLCRSAWSTGRMCRRTVWLLLNGRTVFCLSEQLFQRALLENAAGAAQRWSAGWSHRHPASSLKNWCSSPSSVPLCYVYFCELCSHACGGQFLSASAQRPGKTCQSSSWEVWSGLKAEEDFTGK